MADANPKCKLCGTPKIFIGIGGGATSCCPKDCSACSVCHHPDAELVLEGAKLVEVKVPGTSFNLPCTDRFFRTRAVCSHCRYQHTHDKFLNRSYP
jgi:hypothetical protein